MFFKTHLLKGLAQEKLFYPTAKYTLIFTTIELAVDRFIDGVTIIYL